MPPNRPLLAACSLAAVALSFTAAHADRPDRPPVASIGIYNGVDAAAGVFNQSLTGGLTLETYVVCGGQPSPPGFVTVVGLPTDPDLVANKSSKLSVKQTAYVEVHAVFDDGMSFTQSATAKVASCKSSVKVTDVDKNLNYISGTDKGSFAFSCGDDLATALSLDPAQASSFHAAFPNGVACKAKSVTNAGCFRGDTTIATEAGMRSIRDVRVGDRVWSWDETLQKKVLARVTQTFTYPARALRTVVAGAQTFHVTDRHPFWVEGRGWVEASKLASGDKLRTGNSALVAVRSNERADAIAFYQGYDASADRRAARRHPIFQLQPVSTGAAPSETGIVYNIEVDRHHSYFVGSEQVLVHNK